MSRHYYSADQKQRALDRLIANGGDVVVTSVEIGISERTLLRWRREHGIAAPSRDLPPTTTTTTMTTQNGVADTAPTAATQDTELVQKLHALREKMLRITEILADEIIPAIADAPLNQRVAALTQLTDRVVRLSTELPSLPEDMEYVYEYEVEHHVEKEDSHEEDREDQNQS